MEVILRKQIKGLGDKHELVRVKDGYGRNYLIPQGLAQLATSSEKKHAAEIHKQTLHKRAKEKEEAVAMADQLRKLKLHIEAPASEKGNIYGSVTATQIVNVLKSQGFSVERKDIVIVQPIKTIGTHDIVVRLHKEVQPSLSLEVSAQGAEKKKAEEKKKEATSD